MPEQHNESDVSSDAERTGDDLVIVQVDPDLGELIPNFLSNRQTDIQMIQLSLECDDYPKIRRIGHSLRGAGGAFGFDHLSDIGTQIEEAALAADDVRIRTLTLELAEFMRRAVVVFALATGRA